MKDISSKLLGMYSDKGCHPDTCRGCGILEKSKAFHGMIDYEGVDPVDILFITESYTLRNGGTANKIGKQEKSLVMGVLQDIGQAAASVAFSPAVKCPSVKDADLSTKDRNICRQHVLETVESYRPKLVFCLGNFAMKMLLKKSGIGNKRGSIFHHTLEDGSEIPVIPLWHPYSVITEPKHKSMFVQDIRMGVDKFILGRKSTVDLNMHVLDTVDMVTGFSTVFSQSQYPISCDIETTGLDFRKDNIMSICFGTSMATYAIPLWHKDTPFTDEQLEEVIKLIKPVLENPYNRKILQNIKFDAKFLLRYGIVIKNGWDTKLMAHLFDENMPKSLMDLVKYFYPYDLEHF